MLGLVVLSGFASVGFVREALRSRQIDRQIADLKAESDSLKAKNFQLSSLNASVGEQEFLERQARTELNLKKEGEQVVVVKPADIRPANIASALIADVTGPISNAHKWWLYFSDRKAYDRYAASIHDANQTVN